jgi:hypothetical protein
MRNIDGRGKGERQTDRERGLGITAGLEPAAAGEEWIV